VTQEKRTRDPKARGWVSLYAVAFVLLVLAGAALVSAALGFLASTRLLWVSAGLSALAIVAAVLGVTLPRR
jgi:hypothetical protein